MIQEHELMTLLHFDLETSSEYSSFEELQKNNPRKADLWKTKHDKASVKDPIGWPVGEYSKTYLEENGIQKVKYIDVDLNPDPRYRSNMVLRSALGLIESYGFEARYKPDACAASCVADWICK